jgi:hypothetical protein
LTGTTLPSATIVPAAFTGFAEVVGVASVVGAPPQPARTSAALQRRVNATKSFFTIILQYKMVWET